MPAGLQYNPTPPYPVDFGSVVITGTFPLSKMFHSVSNTGTSPLIVSSLTSSDPTHFKFVDSDDGGTTYKFVPFTLSPGYTSGPFEVDFYPVTLGVHTATITVISNDPGGPRVIPLTGLGVAASGTKAISVDPTSWDFGQVEVGDTSDEKLFRVTSTGSDAVAVDEPTPPPPFALGATQPASYPITIPYTDQIELEGGGNLEFEAGGDIDLEEPQRSFDFGAEFTPVAVGEAVGIMDVPSDADVNPFPVTLMGEGIPLTPYAPTADTPPEVFIVATKPTTAPTVLEGDPEDFDCERDAWVENQTNLDMPGVDKSTYALYLHHEDLGSVEVTALLEALGVSVDQVGAVGTASPDGFTKVTKFLPLEVQGEIIRFRLDREADAGPLSVTDLIIRHEPFAVRKGEAPIPDSITPYAALDTPGEQFMLVFVAEADEATLTIDNARLASCGLPPYECES